MKPRERKPAFTRAQTAVLIFAGILGIFWILFGAAFVLTAGFQNMGAATPAAQSALEPTPTAAPTSTSSAAATIAAQNLIPPTSCAQQNNGVVYAPSALVLDDGTLEVPLPDQVLQVRLAGVRLPEDQALMNQAVAKARAMFAGQDALVVQDASDQDEAGRLVRYVFAGGQFVNYELIRSGLATALRNSPDQACAALLRQAEQQARGDQLGMWSPAPVPTATFVPFVTLDSASQSCDCSVRYLCSDFKTQAAAQVCYNACNDYNSRLDPDRDGVACEALP